jgi:CheY-like chemotaxis protein
MSLTTSVSSSHSPREEDNMRHRRILIVEDDYFQREAIMEAIRDAAPNDINVDFAPANSEAAVQDLLNDSVEEGLYFDAYVIDHHLPWAQGNNIPPAPDDVRQNGPLVAGFRVARQVAAKRDLLTRPGARLPPIVLYTIDDGPVVLRFSKPDVGQYALVKGDDNSGLTELLFPLIS